MSRHGIDRVQKFAFELAKSRGRKKDKCNKVKWNLITMPYWDERFNLMKKIILILKRPISY